MAIPTSHPAAASATAPGATPATAPLSLPARLLGSVDLFQIWWIMSLAIGLGVLSRKRTAPIATSLIVIYLAIGVVIAAIKTAVSGA